MSSIGLSQRFQTPSHTGRSAVEVRWGLGFAGILLFLFVQYTSLPEMYPVLGPLHVDRLAVALAALGYLIEPRVRVGRLSSKGVDILIAAFVVASLFSTLLEIGNSHVVVTNFIAVINWAVIYFLLSRLLISRWRLKVALGLILLLNLKLAQFAIRGFLLSGGGMGFIKAGGAIGGTNAFFGNAGDLGVAMCVAWGITWALFFGTKGKGFQRLALGVCFVFFFLAILVGGTRGAVVGGAAVILAALVRTPKKIAAVLLVVVFLLGLLFVLPKANKNRFSSALNWRNDPDTFSRLMFWQAGIYMWENHPVFGVGPGRFPYVWADRYFMLAPKWSGPRAPHSIYIQCLSELGLAGMLAFLGLVIAFLRLNARTRKRALSVFPEGRNSFEYCLAAGLDLGLVGYLVGGAFLAQLYYPHFWVLLGLAVATYSVCAEKQAAEPALKTPAPPNFRKFPHVAVYQERSLDVKARGAGWSASKIR